MARYNDFRTLEKDVYGKWESIEQFLEEFDWDFFSDSGAVTAQGYELLDDAFQNSSTKEEVAAYVANEVIVIEKRIKDTQNTERSAELSAVGNWLIDYIRKNFEEEIVNEHPEFSLSYLRGC